MNFKDYMTSLTKGDKNLLSTNTGNEHHKTLKRTIDAGLDRKNPNFVAKSHTEKKHLHPKITRCITTKNKNGLAITTADAEFIKNEYGSNQMPIVLTKQEPEKALRQTNVYLCLSPMSPSGYVLKYKGN
jgi:hypothetical protein